MLEKIRRSTDYVVGVQENNNKGMFNVFNKI